MTRLTSRILNNFPKLTIVYPIYVTILVPLFIGKIKNYKPNVSQNKYFNRSIP